MTSQVRIDAQELAGLKELLALAPQASLEALVAGVYEASLLLWRETAERTPTASGVLRASLIAQQPRLLGQAVEGMVGTPLIYAAPVEEGTEPHWPPLQPLIDWVESKLGLSGDEAEDAAQKIVWKIARKGTKGARMFATAFVQNQSQVHEILEKHLRRLGPVDIRQENCSLKS